MRNGIISGMSECVWIQIQVITLFWYKWSRPYCVAFSRAFSDYVTKHRPIMFTNPFDVLTVVDRPTSHPIPLPESRGALTFYGAFYGEITGALTFAKTI